MLVTFNQSLKQFFRIQCFVVLITASLSNGCFSIFSQASEKPKAPNVLIVIADDLGYGELGCYGGDLPTPNLDKLALKGVRCTQGYVTAPFCAASRAALLTGRIQTRFGFEFNPIGVQNVAAGVGLPVEESTLANMLRENGYATALIGKWHLGGTAPFHPQRRGFDQFFGFLHEGHYYVPPPWNGHVTWLRRRVLPPEPSLQSDRWVSSDGRVVWSNHMRTFEPDYDSDNPLLRNSQPDSTAENLTDAFTREAVEFIGRHRSQPFCAVVAYNAVHSPMQAHDRYFAQHTEIEDYHRRIFASMLSHLDDGVGQILNKLDQCDLARDTLVVFLSDNGGPTRELTSSNRPLRGEKGSLLEGGIRVPFLVRWPAHFAGGTIEERPVSSLDIAATIADVLNAKTNAEKPLDGTSWVGLFNQRNAQTRPPLFWRVGNQAALRSGPWKIYRSKIPDASWQLYHLPDDVDESRDLAQREPERLRGLVSQWDAIDATMVAPLWK